MAQFRSLTIQSGVTKQIHSTDELIVGSGIDSDSAGALTLGSTTATSVVLNQNTSVSGSNTFTTTTGLATLGGGLTVSGGTSNFETNVAFTGIAVTASAATSFDLSGATGVFKTTTGAVTIGPGAVTVSGATTFTAAGTAVTVTNTLAAGALNTTVLDTAGANTLSIGDTNATQVSLGHSGSPVVVEDTFFVTGTSTFTGAINSNDTANGFHTAGVVHNSATTGLFTSSLVVNADIAPGTAGQFLFTNSTPATTWETLTGDGALSTGGALTVTAIQNNPVAAITLDASEDGYVLTWDSILGWAAQPVSSATAITLNGDATGPSNANTVVKVHGVSYPATPATNTVPVVTGSNTVTYQQIADAQVASGAAIAGTKISPDFGSQNVTTSGNVSTTGSGAITSAGLLTASAALTVSTGTITVSSLNSAGVVHTDGSGVFSTSKVAVGTDVTGGSTGQVLLTNGTTPTWTTLSGDATVSATGVVTVVSAAGNFEVHGNLTVDGAETIIGTSTFQSNAEFAGNVIIDDGYTLTVNTITSNTSNALTLEAATGFINVPDGMTLHATGTGQIIATSSSGTTALTVPFDTTSATLGYAVYVSSNDTTTNAIATALGTSYCVGFVTVVGSSGEVATDGLVTPVFNGSAPAVGQPAYLDPAVAGQLTATAPSTTGQVVAPVGFMKNATQMIVRVLTPVVL